MTNDPSAPALRLEEDQILKQQYPLDYNALVKEMIGRYTNFVRNSQFHKLRKALMKDENLCRTRYLDPNNPKSSRKDFYSPNILKQFDEHYKKKKE